MPESSWIWQCDCRIPSSPAAGRGVLEEILHHLRQNHWQPREVFGVHLAMEEALANAIKHGNRQDASKQIHVSCRMSPNLFHVEIEDEGSGFDPHSVPDPTQPEQINLPRGRGVMLMRSFMSRVRFNETGNCVVMEKDRSPCNR